MMLIADSGSTKTTWSWNKGDGSWQRHWTDGLNPLTTSEGQMEAQMEALRMVLEEGGREPETVYFYGAGCGTSEAKATVARLLKRTMGEVKVEVETDLMGACRALWDPTGEREQVMGILGTGSNACVYDGERIVKSAPSLGYLLGDEGSGNHIGKQLLKDYVRGRMPERLATAFGEEYGLSYGSVIEQLYHRPNANRYLAQFALFAAKYRGDDYVRGVLEGAFEEYMESMMAPIAEEGQAVMLMGSVAVQFEEEIVAVGARKGHPVTRVMKEPMEGLIHYHE